MTQLNVNAATTFTQIEAQFHATGTKTDDHHIRFDNGTTLYTSKDASIAGPAKSLGGKISSLTGGVIDHLEQYGQGRLDDRAQKQADGATRIKQAMDQEYGAGFGDLVFGNIQRTQNLDLNQGVRRADLAVIQQTIQDYGQLTTKLPQGMTIATDGTLGGQTVIANDVNGQPMQQTIQAKISGYLNAVDHTNAQTYQTNGQWVSDKSKADMPRMHVQIPTANGNFDTHGQLATTSVANLRAFTGSDAATTVLSSVLHQNILNPLHTNMQRNDGTKVEFNNAGSFGAPVTVKTAHGLVNGNARQYGDAQFTLSRTNGGDFRVDIRWPMFVNGVREGLDRTLFPMHAPNGAVQVMHSTSWTIDGNAAALGQIQLQVVNPLNITYFGKLS